MSSSFKLLLLVLCSLIIANGSEAQTTQGYKITLHLKNTPAQTVYFDRYYIAQKFCKEAKIQGDTTLFFSDQVIEESLLLIGFSEKGGDLLLPVYKEDIEIWIDFEDFKTTLASAAIIKGSQAALDYQKAHDREAVERFWKKIRYYNALIDSVSTQGLAKKDSLLQYYKLQKAKKYDEMNNYLKEEVFYKTTSPIVANHILNGIVYRLKTVENLSFSETELQTMYRDFIAKFPHHTPTVQIIQSRINRNMLKLGSKAPSIGGLSYLRHRTDSTLTLEGKYILLDFWASWCKPCREESPYLLKAYQQFHKHNFTIIGISIDDDKAAWQQAIAEDNIGQWTQALDSNKEATRIYKIVAVPSNYLIAPDGKIIAFNLRGERLITKLKEILQTQESTE